MSETALRKKKNADAQAAFRARRANYIATLEETVTSLEAVVVQLQDSCRESRSEVSNLRQENTRLSSALETLRHESRERDKYLRALWHARKANDDPHLDDFPPPPPSYATIPNGTGTSSSSLGTPVTTPLAHPIPYPGPSSENLDPRLQYSQDSSVSLPQNAYAEAPGSAYGDRSPAMPFMNHEGEAVGSNGRAPAIGLSKMNQYTFNNMHGHVRDTGWHTGTNQAAPPGSDPAAGENGSASHSPAFIPSPTMTSNDIPYGPRYPGPMMDGHKTVLPGIDSVPYMMNNNDRSISPAASSPHTSSSTSVNSQFQFVFPTESQERTESDYHRRMGAGPELTLHGGTADVSAYSLSRRRVNPVPERPMLGGMPSYRIGEDPHVTPVAESSQGVNGGSESRGVRRRRDTDQSNTGEISSRSPSPTSHAPISSTLAVIKAQAFGALRRTRTRPKKATEGGVKMALGALEARAIGLGIASSPNKRPRLNEDDGLRS
ncbi:hypothetical protein M0805_004260 [Coniferiporia weirii]|nr:hypothetical protein M0805_004260 [Coniferiporia weirii]